VLENPPTEPHEAQSEGGVVNTRDIIYIRSLALI
jgi:hypothetical protein